MSNVISVRDALEQALEAFEKIALRPWHSQVRAIVEQSIAALKEAIKQQGEPVGFFNLNTENGYWRQCDHGIVKGTPLYLCTSAPTKDAGTSHAGPELLATMKPRPLMYSLDDYWIAPSGEGPKAHEWKDKPHRLLYDLIAAHLYHTSAQTIPDVDWLANVIRSVDGNHTLGAGALAEKIVEALSAAPKGE